MRSPKLGFGEVSDSDNQGLEERKQPLEFQTRHVPVAHLQPLSHFLSCQRQRLPG